MLNSNPVSKLAEGDIEVKIIKQSNHTKWYDVGNITQNSVKSYIDIKMSQLKIPKLEKIIIPKEKNNLVDSIITFT